MGLAIVSLVVAVTMGGSERRDNYNNKLAILVVGLGTWLVITSILGGDFWRSWWGNPYRGDGLVTVLAMITLGLTVKLVPNWWRWIAIGNLGLSLFVLSQSHPDVALTMGNANQLAGYLAITLPFVYELSGRGKWMVLISILAIGLIGSWGGILIVLMFGVIKALYRYPRIMVIMLLLGMTGVLLLYQRDYQRKVVPGYIVAENRERILTKAVMAIGQKPFFGWGWAQFARAFTQIDYPTHYLVDAYVDRTHAGILEVGVAGGVGGLALYLAIAGLAVRILLKSADPMERMLGLCLVLYLIHSQTNITSVAEDWLFWLGVGRAIYVVRG